MFAAPDARQASTEVRAGSMAPPAPEEAGAPLKEQGNAAAEAAKLETKRAESAAEHKIDAYKERVAKVHLIMVGEHG